jgi:hypothetical protein
LVLRLICPTSTWFARIAENSMGISGGGRGGGSIGRLHGYFPVAMGTMNNVDRTTLQNRPGSDHPPAGRQVSFPDESRVVVREAVDPNRPQHVTIFPPDTTGVGVAESRSGFDERVENRLEVKSRAADQPKHVRRCRLLFERLTGLCQQPHVLDGDDGLIGKGRHQLDLPGSKRTHPVSYQRNYTDWFSIPQKRNAKHGATLAKGGWISMSQSALATAA